MIRPGETRDAEAVNAIYNFYIRETHHTFEIEEHSLSQREAWIASYGPKGPLRFLVAERDGRVVGHANTHPYDPRGAYQTSVKCSVFVDPGRKGQGIGRALYEALFESLQGEDVHRAYGIVSMPNPASEKLHLRCGFREVALLSEVGRKFGRYWDVKWFERRMGGLQSP